MPHAQLTITLHEGVWVAEVSRDFPEAVFRVLAAVPGESSGFALIQITHNEVPAIIGQMNDHPQLIDVHMMQVKDGEVTVQVETTAPLLLFSSQAAGLPIKLPVIIQNGRAQVTVNGPSEHLSDLGKQLRDFGLEFEVDQVNAYPDGAEILSDRQQEVLDAAVRYGYYDTPRQCSLTDLAAKLDIAKSTCSELLQRAEGKVIKHYLADGDYSRLETSSQILLK